MFIQEKQAEAEAVIQTAKSMCQAARTAPKAKGMDFVHTAILTDEEKKKLADKMDSFLREKILKEGIYV